MQIAWKLGLILAAVVVLASASSTDHVLAVDQSPASVDSDHDGLRDHFEILRSKTDPMRTDTNGNGLPDSVEDPDRDGVSNWGEQRFDTDPRDSDSDGDGTIDGRDDSNRDGVADGPEQDVGRPLPDHTRPSLAGAAADTPVSYRDGCHVSARSSEFK